MEIADIIPHVEALIFASDHPLPAIEILDLLNQSQGFLDDKVNINQVTKALEAVTERYTFDFYSFEVVESGGGFQFLTKPAYHATVARLNGDKYLKRLSKASLETLAIIAYKQPVTKSDIESIRGVNADYSVQKLLEKELIAIKGRREDAPGKPLLYVTSDSFMDYFGLNSPEDLPRIKEVRQEASLPTLPPVNAPLESLESLKDAEIVAIKVVDSPIETVRVPGSNGSGTAYPVAFNSEEAEKGTEQRGAEPSEPRDLAATPEAPVEDFKEDLQQEEMQAASTAQEQVAETESVEADPESNGPPAETEVAAEEATSESDGAANEYEDGTADEDEEKTAGDGPPDETEAADSEGQS